MYVQYTYMHVQYVSICALEASAPRQTVHLAIMLILIYAILCLTLRVVFILSFLHFQINVLTFIFDGKNITFLEHGWITLLLHLVLNDIL